MFIFVSVLIFIIAVLLIMVILVQNPKGGLASNFSSSNQVMGVRKTTDFLEKATWTLGIALFVLSVVSSSTLSNDVQVVSQDSELIDEANSRVISPSAAPVLDPNAPTENAPQAAPDASPAQTDDQETN